MTETTMEPDVLVDGRTARRDRNRELVLDAAIELFTENDLAPDAASVAERSGVSLRSVYRYFEDHDSLVRAAIARHAERIAPLLVIPDLGVGPFDERVERLVTARMRVYEAAAPTARVAVLRAPNNPPLREQMDRLRATLRAQTEAMFEPELSAMDGTRRHAMTMAMDALLQFEAVDHLRVRRGLSTAQTTDVLGRTLTALLT